MAMAALMLIFASGLFAQQSSSAQGGRTTIRGVVVSRQHPVAEATVRLAPEATGTARETKTDAAGKFAFKDVPAGLYRLTAEKSGQRSGALQLPISPKQALQRIELVLGGRGTLQPSAKGKTGAAFPPMQFADAPNFKVAGMTDWTAVGGHGSDSILRTSEALAHDTLALKKQGEASSAAQRHESEVALRAAVTRDSSSFEANHQLGEFLLNEERYRDAIPLLARAYRIRPDDSGNGYDLARAYEESGKLQPALELVNRLLATHPRAELHRLAGDIHEKLGDPVAAVHAYAQAARMHPSEENYFVWGSELLYHRAVWQALEVFRQGAEAYPKSSRMLTALGSAQFAGARYDKAAMSLCKASDLDPENQEPYIFMGKVEVASPDPLPCVQTRLARFVHEHPDNSTANYMYAMALLKGHEMSSGDREISQAEALLKKAVSLDHACGEAYLQLGILSFTRHDIDQAIAYYKDAIAGKPQLAESYYRLGVAYDRLGKREQARHQFQLHDEVVKKETKAVDARRRTIKQFLIQQDSVRTVPARQ